MEREEGELTDEELEDVSDSSITIEPFLVSGKSPPLNREPFRELSLTSISDETDEDKFNVAKYKVALANRDVNHQRCRCKRQSRNYDLKRTRRLPKRLSPIKIEHGRKESSSSESELNAPKRKVLKQLRDAVRISTSQNLPNRSLRTRLKGMIEPDSGSKNSNSDEDQELETLRDQALQSKPKNGPPVNSDEADEKNVDDDLINLRLIALQSAVLKKHQNRRKRKEEQQKLEAEQNVEETPTPPNCNGTDVQKDVKDVSAIKEDEDEDILRAMLLTSISKKISNKKSTIKNATDTLPKSSVKPNIHKLPPSVPMNRFVINVNSDSDSDNEKTVIEKNTNGQADLFNKNLSKFLQQARAQSEIDQQNDLAKHIPQSQQAEYKKLKRKLQLLSNRMKPLPKIKRTDSMDENKKIVKKPVGNSTSNRQLIKPTPVKKVPRLQNQGKYEELTPLMSRVSEARIARDKSQAKVKRLINELKAARLELTSTHQTYTLLMQQVMKAKSNVDKRFSSQELKEVKNNKPVVMCTSTPNKIPLKEITCELSAINASLDPQNDLCETKKPATDLISLEPKINEIELKLPLPMNDIQIPEPTENGLLKYESPLEHMQLNKEQSPPNPLIVLCPYDLQGICRDSDCSYQHCAPLAE